MNTVWFAAVPVSLSWLMVGSLAWADVAPPGPETCTLESQQEAGETCVKCRASFQDPDACQGQYGAEGYQQRCKTRGASVWSEIWCRRAARASDASAPPPRDGADASAARGAAHQPGIASDAGPKAPSSLSTTPKAGCGACVVANGAPLGASLLCAALLLVGSLVRRSQTRLR